MAQVEVSVLRDFYDIKADAMRKAGETFACSEERYGEISAKLPEYVEKKSGKTPARKRAAEK